MKRILISLGLLSVIALAACNQNTIAALVSTLGNSCSTLAQMQGNTQLAATIKADTATAVADIAAWKPGTDGEMAIQALHILENDLHQICATIPGQTGQDCQKYEPLIQLALGTADSIIAIVQPQRVTAKAQKTCPTFDLACKEPKGAPTDAKEFKRQWNAIVAANPALAGAKL